MASVLHVQPSRPDTAHPWSGTHTLLRRRKLAVCYCFSFHCVPGGRFYNKLTSAETYSVCNLSWTPPRPPSLDSPHTHRARCIHVRGTTARWRNIVSSLSAATFCTNDCYISPTTPFSLLLFPASTDAHARGSCSILHLTLHSNLQQNSHPTTPQPCQDLWAFMWLLVPPGCIDVSSWVIFFNFQLIAVGATIVPLPFSC